MSNLSDYEKERLEKIAKNKLFMASLGLDKKIIPKKPPTPAKEKPKYVASRSSQRLEKDRAEGKVVVYNEKKKSQNTPKKKRRKHSDSEDEDDDDDEEEEDDEESSEYSAFGEYSEGDDDESVENYTTSDDLEAEELSGDEAEFKVVPKNKSNNKNNKNNKNNNNINNKKKNTQNTIINMMSINNNNNNENNSNKRERNIEEVSNDLRKSSRIATHLPISYKKMNTSSNYNEKAVPHATKPPVPSIPISSDESSSDESPASKRNSNQIKIMFSNIEDQDTYIPIIYQLKAELSKNIKFCTHLITCVPLKRTKKFFAAIRYAKYIVTVDWLKDSIKAAKLIDEKPYLFRDVESEKLWKFNLQDSMKKSIKHGAFNGVNCFLSPITASLENEHQGIREIIKNAGGNVVNELKKPVSGTMSGFYVIITTKEEADEMVKTYSSYSHNLYFVDKEFVFLSILRQNMCFEEKDLIFHSP